jgi:hypothetical protein
MIPLILHPSCETGPIKAISAQIHGTSDGCMAEFTMKGDLSRIKIPTHQASVREDDLWKTTCFEIFWQPIGGSYYREINLSPSSKWAAYDFDDFRKGMRDAPMPAMSIACSRNDSALTLKASVACDLPDPAQVALNAVVEGTDGNIQYWALAFPPGKPDFHSEDCRIKKVDRTQ